MEVKFKNAFGDLVEDRITGFIGKVVYRSKFINGCVRVTVQPDAKDNVIPKAYVIDQVQLKLVEPSIISKKKKFKFEFEFGDVVKDILTGFEGSVTGVIVTNKNKSYYVQPKVGKDNTPVEDDVLPENRLILVSKATGEETETSEVKEPGGPMEVNTLKI